MKRGASVTIMEDSDSDESETLMPPLRDVQRAERVLRNFVWMAALFSANHGCTVACLALATARLGLVGAWQSGLLFFTYTGSAVLGATYVTKQLGSRNAIMAGMALYCAYVGCFLVATLASASTSIMSGAAYVGAAIGGIGGGFLWTAQGAYFSQSSEEHAKWLQHDIQLSTSQFAGIFAFVYLAEEVLLRLLATAMLETGHLPWGAVFGVYTTVAIVSTMGMVLVHNYPKQSDRQGTSVFYKITAAIQLLVKDPKMKHMIGLNSVFGFAGAFLNSFVNGEVERVALDDPNSRYVGALSSLVAVVAAIISLVLAPVSQHYGKGPVLVGGALCFAGIALLFIIQPNAAQWGWGGLILVYTLHGIGRATFESTLKATFAEYFSYEKEGAFANIILQNGLSSTIGYILSSRLRCESKSTYCVEFHDGSLHDMFSFELLVVASAVLAVVGYLRASVLYQNEHETPSEAEHELIENESGVSA